MKLVQEDDDSPALPSFQKTPFAISSAEEKRSLISSHGQHEGGSASHSGFGRIVLSVGLLVVIAGLLFHPFQEKSPVPDIPFSDIVSAAPTEASYKKKNKKKKKEKSVSRMAVCDDGKYSKRTLKLAYELPFASLFTDTKGQRKYEASSVVLGPDGNAYAVCDSSWSISKFSSKLEPFAPNNVQIGDPSREQDDSGYEALFLDDGSFYVVRESIQHKDESYHAVIEKLNLGDEDYEVQEACSCEFEFEGDSKGFEGAISVRDLDNNLVVLGLCEGNHCSEERKNDIGNGQVVAMRRTTLPDGTCQWATIRKINIPSSAAFRDYSAMTLDHASGRIAISSQEESQVWIGTLLGKNEAGMWDIDAIEFDAQGAKLYDFPKSNNCETIYCNVEGVHWLNSEMLLAVSDKMKSGGKQDYRCFDKDQSVHVFVIP